MRCYVGYISSDEKSNSQFGAVTCKFDHYPPTKDDIFELQKNISEQLDGANVIVMGWNELSDEENPDVNNNTADLVFRIKNTDLKVGDTLEIEDEFGSCLYQVEFGLYTFAQRSHMGWYLKLMSVSEGYPEQFRKYERPVCDIREADDIKSIKVIV